MHYEFDDILLEKTDLDIDNIINELNPIDLNYDQLKQDLSAIKYKSSIYFIDRSNYSLNKLEENTFDEFYFLIELDLSHNLLTSIQRGVFDQLWILQKINLSHNLISNLEDYVFKNNMKLQTINLSNNLLTKINRFAIQKLPLLRKLDFSRNSIEKLSEDILSIPLNELNLSYNQIDFLSHAVFQFLSNLIHLDLSHNKITYLNETIFLNTRKIEILNFSNNFIRKLDKKTFIYMTNLRQVDFSNNLLIGLGKCLENKPILNELNLLNNQLSRFWIKDLLISQNICILKLTINEPVTLEGLLKLKALSDFELYVKTDVVILLYQSVLFWLMVSTIQRLYIVIQKGIFDLNYEISYMFNLKFLHIEFLEQVIHLVILNIGFHINKMPKLNHLSLININKLIIISDCNIKYNNLTYLNLTGIDNVYVDFLKNNFVMLEHLNLSFSNVEFISCDLMSTLPNLKLLNMNGTRISVIEDNLFQYNSNLEVIFLQDCQIHTIAEKAFRNLVNLKEIDVRGNTQLRITQSLLNGISKSAIIYYD